MPKALWKGTVVAETDTFEEVDGNIYFPPASLKKEFFKKSDQTSICPWKGEASYYHVEVNGQSNQNCAWAYPTPKDAAKNIKDHMAFWNGIEVQP